jgi:chemotaxis protein CheD
VNKIILHIGDIAISSEPAIMETILGSCVSVCLWDNRLNIGGMNHYMLPYTGNCLRCIRNPTYSGIESIKILVSDILKMGASLHNLRAKLFGGCKIFDRYFAVGRENVMVANWVLKEYGIPVIERFTMCEYGLKVIFHTATGKAFVKILQDDGEWPKL